MVGKEAHVPEAPRIQRGATEVEGALALARASGVSGLLYRIYSLGGVPLKDL